MKKIKYIVFAFILSLSLADLLYIFVETDSFLRKTLASVGGKNVVVELCPIRSNKILGDCSLAANQDAAISSLRGARKQLPLGHAVSQRAFFLRIRSVTDNGSNIYCLIAHQYKDQEELLFLAQLELEVNCNEGTFKYLAGSLAIDNFLIHQGSP